MTDSGRLLARFEATLRSAFGEQACADLKSKTAWRFVACRPPAARYAYFVDTFQPSTDMSPLPVTASQPQPGSFGVTNAPIEIGMQYVLCRPGHYLLRTSAVSFGLGCS